MKLIISKNRHKVYKDFLILGYTGETNSRIVYVTQPEIENANSYKLRFTYDDNVTYDVPIENQKIFVTNSLLRKNGEVKCQWIAVSTADNVIAKSEVFSLIIENSLPDGTAVPPPEKSVEALEQCKSSVNQCESLKEQCETKANESKAYAEQALNALSTFNEDANKIKNDVSCSLLDKTISENLIENLVMNEDTNVDDPNAGPFNTENYDYIDLTYNGAGQMVSDVFELENGVYGVISTEKTASIYIYLYDPYEGYYDECKHFSKSEWEPYDDNKYIATFSVDTEYTHNYVRLFTRISLSKWNTYELQLGKMPERYATNENVNQQINDVNRIFSAAVGILGDNIKSTNKNIDRMENEIYDEFDTTNEQIAKNTSDIKNCHCYFSTYVFPANIDTINHKVIFRMLLVLTAGGTGDVLSNVELDYPAEGDEQLVYYDFDTKTVGIQTWNSRLPQNSEVIMNLAPNKPTLANGRVNITVDGEKI